MVLNRKKQVQKSKPCLVTWTDNRHDSKSNCLMEFDPPVFQFRVINYQSQVQGSTTVIFASSFIILVQSFCSELFGRSHLGQSSMWVLSKSILVYLNIFFKHFWIIFLPLCLPFERATINRAFTASLNFKFKFAQRKIIPNSFASDIKPTYVY